MIKELGNANVDILEITADSAKEVRELIVPYFNKGYCTFGKQSLEDGIYTRILMKLDKDNKINTPSKKTYQEIKTIGTYRGSNMSVNDITHKLNELVNIEIKKGWVPFGLITQHETTWYRDIIRTVEID